MSKITKRETASLVKDTSPAAPALNVSQDDAFSAPIPLVWASTATAALLNTSVSLPKTHFLFLTTSPEPRWPPSFDPLGNSVHSTLATDLVGKDVFIAGAGPIGLMSIAVAKKAGARFVVISDINDYRLKMAKKMGATKAVNIKKEKMTEVMKKLGICGFDVCLEMSGNAKAFGNNAPALPNQAAISYFLA